MTRLLLVRHGETEWNAARRIQGWTNSRLSDRGHRQAAAVAARLARSPLDAVYASDLTRALDTAAAVAAPHGLSVNPLPALREKSYGDWEGMTAAEIAVQYPDLWHRYHTRRDLHVPVPGGELWTDVQPRIVGVVTQLCQEYAGQTVAVVGHGGSLRVAILHALRAPLTVLTHLRLDNASLTCLDFPPNAESRLALLNDTSHLEDEAS